jgi:hypothetical protein
MNVCMFDGRMGVRMYAFVFVHSDSVGHGMLSVQTRSLLVLRCFFLPGVAFECQSLL